MTADELMELLRKSNVFQFSDVEFAMMEPSGNLSLLLKKENRPVTAKDLKLKVGSSSVPKTVIMAGKIVSEGWQNSGFEQKWLLTELEKNGCKIE